MTTEPKTPDTRPGADVTDGATGKPYSQAGEKSAGQLLYEIGTRGVTDPLPWDRVDPKIQARYRFNATVTPKNQTIKAP